MPRVPLFDYLSRQRHILLDMHTPDWDPGFLAKFDPVAMADLYASAGADAAMHYCNSHVGLNYWPSAVGAMHRGLGGRDLVGETVAALHARGLASCAYYSSYFHNWAWNQHPGWRIAGGGAGGFGAGSKYGVCCPTNPDYHAFQRTQVAELARAYAFDAFFFDMIFWTEICVCDSCCARFRTETGGEIPETIDWTSPGWCAFAAARESWLAEAFSDLTAVVREHADIPVFSNISLFDRSWVQGVGLATLAPQGLLGGDFGALGGDTYVTSHLIASLTPSVQQYMNAFTGYIGGASFMIEPDEQFAQHALVSLLFGGQFMAIDAVESDGSVNRAFYEATLAEVFARMAPYAGLMGGRPVADVGVYFSDASRMSLDESGVAIAQARAWEPPPHMRALRGALRALQSAQIPAAVVTRADLADLSRYRVLVLPNVARMSAEETAAVRAFVAGGGRLYASAHTSRLDAAGGPASDFALADVFGCAFESAEGRAVVYLRPQRPDLAAAIAPRIVTAHGNARSPAATGPSALVHFHAESDAEALATLDLPFGEGRGDRANQRWSSIHAQPPYLATDRPMVVRRRYGDGEVIYCAADIEASLTAPHAPEGADAGPARLFVALIERLLDGAPLAWRLRADPGVAAVAFDDPGRRRLHIANLPPRMPSRPVPRVEVTLRPPAGRRPTRLTRLPGGEPVAHSLAADGAVRAEIRDLEHFVVLSLEWE